MLCTGQRPDIRRETEGVAATGLVENMRGFEPLYHQDLPVWEYGPVHAPVMAFAQKPPVAETVGCALNF